MPEPEPTAAADPPKAPLIAGRSRSAICLFLVIAIGLLAADLWVKQAAFRSVAETPIRLTRDDAGEPLIWIRTQRPPPMDAIHQDLVEVEVIDAATDEKIWWVQQPRHPQHPHEPASAIPSHEPTVVIPGVLNLQLTINTGAVFGMGKGFRTGFLLIGAVAIVIITWFFVRSPRNEVVFQVALALILSGALGNLYDRYFFAAVRDMFHLLPGTRLWPWIFNVADVALVVGVCLVVLHTFRKDLQARKAVKEANTTET